MDQIYAKQAIISHLNFREFQWIRSHIRKCADQQVKGSTFDQGKKRDFLYSGAAPISHFYLLLVNPLAE